jgi:hypothetical protein
MSAAARNQRQPVEPSQGPVRSLRVGIVLGGNIIEERLIRGRENITIGQSAKNTFSVPLESLPKQWPLFTVENGRYVLHYSDGTDGRISDGRGVHTLDSLKGRGAERRGDHFVLPLVDGSRGKVVMGDMTLLFQFVNAPPLQPRPRLPASVRGTLADRVDPQMAIILAISVVAHLVLMLVAWNHDRTVESRADRIHREFQEDSFKERTATLELTQPTTATTGEEVEAPKGDDKGADKEPDRGSSKAPGDGGQTKEPGDGGAPSDAQVDEAIANTALVALLTGDESAGGRYGKMSETDQGAGLDKAIENAKGKEISSIGGGAAGRGHREGAGQIGGDKEGGRGKVSGPGEGGQVGGKQEELISRIKLGDVEDIGDGTLDPDSVYRTIQSRYLEGIKRCHQQLLKRNPEAGGRVSVRFTVGPTGGVTKSTVSGFDPTVDACIKGLTLKWRFGAPKTDEGKPSSADFQFPFILKAGT